MIDIIVEGLVLVSTSINTTNAPRYLESVNKFLSDWIGVLVAVIGGILSIISFFYNRKDNRLKGLSEAFQILNDNIHREARRVVHTDRVTPASRKILGFDNTVDEKEVKRVCLDIVETDMDQIGAMAQNKLLIEKVFLQRYSTSIFIEWIKCEEDINSRRNGRHDQEYRKSFEDLKNLAIRYWEKKYGKEAAKEKMKTIREAYS